jgi:hypothetical protein
MNSTNLTPPRTHLALANASLFRADLGVLAVTLRHCGDRVAVTKLGPAGRSHTWMRRDCSM